MRINYYLKKILNTRVYDVAIKTNLDLANDLSSRLENTIYLKREDKQPVFSFKLRGAYNKMTTFSREILDKGVITASAGNHAQGVAYSAARLGCKAVIVVPVTTPQVKIDSIYAHGQDAVEIIQFGDSYTDAYEYALLIQKERQLTFIAPFDDPEVIAGQGTIGMEILQEHPRPIHAIFIPIGGGGLAAGVAAYVKAIRPEIKIIGVQTIDSCAMLQSIEKKERITLQQVGIFSDGTAVKQVGEETFKLCAQLLDDIVLVDTDQLCAAIKDIYQDTRTILEPAGALSIAGLKAYIAKHQYKHQTFIAITSGANINFDRLRFVADRAEIGETREAIFSVAIPEQPGSFKKLCALLGNRNITELTYRVTNQPIAHVFIRLQIQSKQETKDIQRDLHDAQFNIIDLTYDEVAKQHIRYMIGGHAHLNQKEYLYRFIFPERVGTLLRFLSLLHPDWNISLFHYRNQGSSDSSVLVGLQIPENHEHALQEFLTQLGYTYSDETNHQAYQIFLSSFAV